MGSFFLRAIFRRLWVLLGLALCAVPLCATAGPLASLQSYTGIWNMPTARVLPDWNMRFGYGRAEPYRYYGGALGLLDRLEFHGQFTEISSLEAFEGYDYGYYKDRAAGFRLVLLKENEVLPQVALGAFDATGTALFAQRYLVASKRFGPLDLTLGLGQGTLGGELVSAGGGEGSGEDSGYDFLFSSPNRPTRAFGGLEYDLTSRLALSAEYSSIDREKMYGYRDTAGNEVHDPGSDRWPINFGLKYHGKNWQAHLALLRGDTLAGGVQVAFPLELNSMLGWRKTPRFAPGASLAYLVEHAENDRLASLLAEQLGKEGFSDVRVIASASSVWVEFYNGRHLEIMRSFGHLANVLDAMAPARITTFYLNQTRKQQIVQSFKLPRQSFRAFMDNRLDSKGLQSFADLGLNHREHWREFEQEREVSRVRRAAEQNFSYALRPRLYTFLNNKAGFFKHKGALEVAAGYRLWSGARLTGILELVAFNQYDDLAWSRYESDSVRTDMVEYQRQTDPQLTQLAFEQHFQLPGAWQSRAAVGFFERAYAGFGLETFRLFNDGRWGIGFETEAVRKRAIDDNFELRDEPGMDKWFYTGFVNLYAQLWPSQGVEGGLKIGRFLAGDPGVSIELRRSFKHFTIGAWYTITDTSLFNDPRNRNAEAKGVFIRFPLAFFKDRDVPGHLQYGITSFTTDQGQTVAQPSTLYPMDPWDTPVQGKRDVGKMRVY